MDRQRSVSESQWRPRSRHVGPGGGEGSKSQSSLMEDSQIGEQDLLSVDQVADYRFLGTVIAIKTIEKYGFIQCDQMETDVFFGMNHVVASQRNSVSLIHKAVTFTVKYSGKRLLEARQVKLAPENWQPEILRGRIMEWMEEGCLIQVTSGSGLSVVGNRLRCSGEECRSLQLGKLGGVVTFQLGMNSGLKLEAKHVKIEMVETKEVEVIAGTGGGGGDTKLKEKVKSRNSLSEGEELMTVKQVTSDEFSGDLITDIKHMDVIALGHVFDKQLRQRLVTLVQQPIGSRIVIAVIERAVILESTRVEDNITRMVVTNFYSCCTSRHGCNVVQTCLETFSKDNKLLISEQLLELDTKDQLLELWQFGSHVFTLCLDFLDSSNVAAVAFTVSGSYISLSCNIRYYRPIRDLLSRITTTDFFPEILPELEQELISLACNRFGHIVVMSLLEKSPSDIKSKLIENFQGRLEELSCHPVCHAVIVAVVQAAFTGQQAALIEEVCTVSSKKADMAVIRLTKDKFGHVVVLAMLKISQHKQVHNLLKASILCKQEELVGNEWARKVMKTIKTEFHSIV